MKLLGGRPSQDGNKQQPGAKQRIGEARAARGEERLRAFRSGFRNIVSEMKRVTWPTREEWISATVVVISLVVIVAVWTKVVSVIVEYLFKFGGQ